MRLIKQNQVLFACLCVWQPLVIGAAAALRFNKSAALNRYIVVVVFFVVYLCYLRLPSPCLLKRGNTIPVTGRNKSRKRLATG